MTDPPYDADADFDLAETEDDDGDLLDLLDSAVNSGIGRIVALATVALLPIFASLCAWLQDALGIDLQPGPLAAFVASIVGAGGLLAWQWLRARGDWEKEALKLLHKTKELPLPGGVGDLAQHPDWGRNVTPSEDQTTVMPMADEPLEELPSEDLDDLGDPEGLEDLEPPPGSDEPSQPPGLTPEDR